jgi:hypothetical protein
VNSFNVLRTSSNHIEIERHSWDGARDRFARFSSEAFERSPDGWKPCARS